MYGKLLVCIGLALFVGVVTFPFWIASGRKPAPPPVLKAGLTRCVEPVEYMRANHMLLLDEWRNSVVRRNDRVYVNSAGQHFEKSLTRTCLGCHSNKAEFCDRCHNAVAVKPYCWNCHLGPAESPAAAMPPSLSNRTAAAAAASREGE